MPVDLLPRRASPAGPAAIPAGSAATAGRTPAPVGPWDHGHGIFCTLLHSGGNVNDLTVYTSGTVTPPPGSLILGFIDAAQALGVEPSTPAVDGVGLSFDPAAEVWYKQSGNTLKLFLFHAMTQVPHDPGTISIDFGSGHIGARWQFIACSGVDPSGANGAGAIGQTAVNSGNIAAGSALSVVLPGAPVNGHSRTVAGFGNNSTAANATIERAGWRELAESNHSTPAQDLETQWRLDQFEGTASGTQNDTLLLMGGIAVELVAAMPPLPAPDRAAALTSQYGGLI